MRPQFNYGHTVIQQSNCWMESLYTFNFWKK